MPSLEIANFVCKFGDKVLNDYLEEIVIPAFSTKEVRKWRKNLYFLFQVQYLDLPYVDSSGVAKSTKRAIIGRLVKSTKLISNQDFEDGKLIKVKKILQTSPSSLFILYLEKHKLVYVPEMAFAPSINDFEYCMAWFLKNAHKSYLKELQLDVKARNKRIVPRNRVKIPTKVELAKIHRAPTLTITNIGTAESLQEFINSFRLLKHVVVELLPVNEEKDGSKLLNSIRETKEKIRSKTTILSHRNSDGLNKVEVVEHLSKVNEAGNHKVKLSGVDDDGMTMIGTNENFKLKKNINELSREIDDAVNVLHPEIMQMIDAGVIPPIA